MNTKKLLLSALLCCLNLSLAQKINASFPEGTIILTPSGPQPIEALSGNLDKPITSLNPVDGTITKTKINCIRIGFECKLMLIATDKGSVIVGKKQKLFEGKKCKFVAAEDLCPGDVLASKDRGNCTCLYLEEVGNRGNMYEISLEKPNAYFVSELRLLAIK